MIRRWFATKLEVGPVSEVYVEGADAAAQLKSLKLAIAAKSGLPVDRIALTDVRLE